MFKKKPEPSKELIVVKPFIFKERGATWVNHVASFQIPSAMLEDLMMVRTAAATVESAIERHLASTGQITVKECAAGIYQ